MYKLKRNSFFIKLTALQLIIIQMGIRRILKPIRKIEMPSNPKTILPQLMLISEKENQSHCSVWWNEGVQGVV